MGLLVNFMIDIRAPLANIRLYISVCLLFAFLHAYFRKERQKYTQAPITGIAHNGELPKARKRFRLEAEEMLADGYCQVKIHMLVRIPATHGSPSSRTSRSTSPLP